MASDVPRWLAMLLLLAAGCSGAPAQRLTELPRTVAVDSVEGKLTVVVFLDFECQFSRAQYPDLLEAIAPARDRIHLVRRYTPLRVEGVTSASAGVCADATDRGDAFARTLFARHEFDEASVLSVAREVGLDGPELLRCMADPATAHRLQIDSGASTGAAVRSLPTTFIGMDRFDGWASGGDLEDSVRSQIDAASRRTSHRSAP